MTICDEIDRARRGYARGFEPYPYGVILTRAQINDATMERIWRSNFIVRDPARDDRATYKGMVVFVWKEGVSAFGPVIFGEAVAPQFLQSGLATWAGAGVD